MDGALNKIFALNLKNFKAVTIFVTTKIHTI